MTSRNDFQIFMRFLLVYHRSWMCCFACVLWMSFLEKDTTYKTTKKSCLFLHKQLKGELKYQLFSLQIKGQVCYLIVSFLKLESFVQVALQLP